MKDTTKCADGRAYRLAFAGLKLAPLPQLALDALAGKILGLLLSAENSCSDLDLRLQKLVLPSGWSESLARCVLDGLVQALNTGLVLAGKAKAAYDRASAAAAEFVKEHPMLTAIAIGMLAILAPRVVELLGFAVLGPVKGECL